MSRNPRGSGPCGLSRYNLKAEGKDSKTREESKKKGSAYLLLSERTKIQEKENLRGGRIEAEGIGREKSRERYRLRFRQCSWGRIRRALEPQRGL